MIMKVAWIICVFMVLSFCVPAFGHSADEGHAVEASGHNKTYSDHQHPDADSFLWLKVIVGLLVIGQIVLSVRVRQLKKDFSMLETAVREQEHG